MVNALDAISAVLAAKWPGRFCYVDVLKKDFKRPSFFVERLRVRTTPLTRNVTSYSVDLSITCFVTTDDYNQQSQLDLLALQDEVLALFSSGTLPVGDRSLCITALSGGSLPGEAFVDLTVEYTDDTPREQVEHALMQDVKINYGR